MAIRKVCVVTAPIRIRGLELEFASPFPELKFVAHCKCGHEADEMQNFFKGEVVSFRVQTSAEVSGWSPPVVMGIVVAEHGLAHGANPEQTLEIVPACSSTSDEVLDGNRVRVSLERGPGREENSLLVVEFSLRKSIPRNWIIEKRGSISNLNLQKIEDALAQYF